MTATPTPLKGLRAIALFKASKAALGWVLWAWLFTTAHHDVPGMAQAIARNLHLERDWWITQAFLAKAAQVTDANVRLVTWLCLAYGVVHGAEAVGLWRGRLWAEWFTFLSGAIYITPEVISIVHQPTWVNLSLLAGSLIITTYVGWMICLSRQRRRAAMMTA